VESQIRIAETDASRSRAVEPVVGMVGPQFPVSTSAVREPFSDTPSSQRKPAAIPVEGIPPARSFAMPEAHPTAPDPSNATESESPLTNSQPLASLPQPVQASVAQPPLGDAPTSAQSELPNQTFERIPAPVSGTLFGQVTEADETVTSQSQPAVFRNGSSPTSGSTKPSQPALSRTSHESVTVAQSTHPLHPLQVQPVNQAGDSSAVLRDPSATLGAAGSTSRETLSSNDAALPEREPFATLDTATGPGTPSLVHAGIRRAEAGFQDPSLGWVGVRADTSGGQVHATLVPGSAEAAQTLDGHMAGLHSYLADVHTPVDSLTLSAPESRESAFSTSQNLGQGMNQGAHQNSGQGSTSESASPPQPAAPLAASASSTEIRTTAVSPGNQPLETYGRSGAHISVIA
jgi:hypothetical protein